MFCSLDDKSWAQLSLTAAVDDKSGGSAGGGRRLVLPSLPPGVCLADKADGAAINIFFLSIFLDTTLVQISCQGGKSAVNR